MSRHLLSLRWTFGRPSRIARWPWLINHSAKRDRGSQAHSSRQYLVCPVRTLSITSTGRTVAS
eukprot:6952101-Heterocapsa_arctica.AAC.1